jgi:hypothetical protein
MGEGMAVFLVFSCTVAAWVFSVRRSLIVPVRSRQSLIGRAINISLLGFVWSFAIILLATIVGSAAGSKIDLLMMPFLLIVSVVGVILGRRMTVPGRPPVSQRERTVAVVLWTCAIATTLTACAELAGNS